MGWDVLKQKHRISTTISMKHWALLEKYTEKFYTHQKVLEYALENMDTGLMQTQQSKEEEFWMRIGRDTMNSVCLIPKDGYKELIATMDIGRIQEYIQQRKPLEYLIEYYCQKPLNECRLEEILEGILISSKATKYFDSVSYTDNGDYYSLKLIHELGVNNSMVNKILFGSLFNTCEAKTESKISERSLFIKIYKKN